MNEEQIWAEVYEILIMNCGATSNEMWREMFIHSHMRNKDRLPREFRFQGDLGYGGKFHHEHDGFRVDCYLEDLNDYRKKVIEETNSLLVPIYENYVRL